MLKLTAILLPLVAALASKECDPPPPPTPKVISFSVSPSTVCPGDVVTVSWNTSGAIPVLYSSDIDVAEAFVKEDWSELVLDADAGSKQVTITGNMTFRAGSYFSDTNYAVSEAHAVTVVNMDNPILATKFLACKSGGWSSWETSTEWTKSLLVTNVANDGNRAIQLTHAGQEITIAEQGAQQLPPGVPLHGKWTATATLKPGEGCPSTPSLEGPGPILVKPPDLPVRFQYTCPAPPSP